MKEVEKVTKVKELIGLLVNDKGEVYEGMFTKNNTGPKGKYASNV